MTSFVSSYGRGVDEAYSQSKLNACLKGLHDLVDTYTPEKTTQGFYDLEIEAPYYEGLTKDVNPSLYTLPVLVSIAGLMILIGVIEKKTFSTTKPLVSSERISQYKFISTTGNVEWKSEEKINILPDDPINTDETTETAIDREMKDRGAVLTEKGTSTHHVYTSYGSLVLKQETLESGDIKFWWEALKRVDIYNQDEFDRTLDLSNYILKVNCRYIGG